MNKFNSDITAIKTKQNKKTYEYIQNKILLPHLLTSFITEMPVSSLPQQEPPLFSFYSFVSPPNNIGNNINSSFTLIFQSNSMFLFSLSSS